MQLRISDNSEALKHAIRVSQAVNRVRQLPTVFVANPLIALFVAVVYWGNANNYFLLGFVSMMTVLWVPAAMGWRRLRKRRRPDSVSPQNEMRALVFSLAAGAIWAAAAYVLFPLGGPDERTTLVLMLSGLCAGSVAFFSSSPLPSVAFYLPFMLMLNFQAIRYDLGPQAVLPAAIFAFTTCSVLFTRTGWHEFVATVRIIVERDEALALAHQSKSQLEKSLSHMSDLALVDDLTGLKNRRAFFDNVEQIIAGSRRRGLPVSVALLDLDHFKLINDTYGHVAGDMVLKEVAIRIVNTLRDEQTVGRFGGEEFVILLADTSPAQALNALERVRKAIGDKEIVLPNGLAIKVTGSGGIAPLRDDESIEVAIDQADKAMYRAKALGRDRNEVALEV